MSATDAPGFGSIDIASHPSPDGLVDVTAFSWSLDRRADLTLFAPRGTHRELALPLVVLLHGVYGSHWAWARSGSAHRTLQDMVDAGQVRPMVLAMPSDGLVGIGSGYVAAAGRDTQTWITQEVPTLAREVFPHAGDAGVAIAGLSMGGWGALRLAARHPGLYRAAVGMSPLTRWSHVAGYANERHREAHSFPIEDPDLAELLISRQSSLPPLRITCGTEDDLIGDVRGLHERLAAAGVAHEYSESSGGHSWSVWERELRTSLAYIDARL